MQSAKSKMILFLSYYILGMVVVFDASAQAVRAGMAKVDITPELPIWLSGYASREKPAEGIVHALWAKALVIEESPAKKIVIVTVDVLGLSHEIIEEVTRQVQAKYSVNQSQLLFNSSHTHTGPVIWPCLDVVYELEPADQKRVSAYGHQLILNLVKVIDSAMANLSPALLYSGHGDAGFAINRRNQIHPNGPVDHDVPVMKVVSPEGRTRAVLFGYACHNTTIVDEYQLISGDYAGFAQLAIEQNNPGAIALFMLGCAGDQNPEPRSTLQNARDHGNSLAGVVQEVLNGNMKQVRAPIQTANTTIPLAFKPFDLAKYQQDMVGDNKYLQRRAKLMLQSYNKGWKVDTYVYPIQAVRFNKDFTILALSDEVVVDYALQTKAKFSRENLFVAGYCNKVDCYIPNKRILKEGGYEPEDSMIYYGFPGPFADDVEARITIAIEQVMKQVGAVPGQEKNK
ncbi:neutral/alkaline non-lysosomal ceramidase N-terminal domain-containing protein [Flavihumibacter profundi]|jgi:neutral ceramidase|uniref:neutral/alkaline non-lysosomal ceramidase N-terminal domain-containing protein n=1 Tax=Flavihumibacter profundi TaxID=2716883 RepID=UPI001CC72305|nr:neutral/alkaline non-lysosomal ceramidase N-terminal domain-containing protein [Flavihumibacter profundi]MBZ5859348.1 neutral/alkaline non-lysosomal ceramidase N-terminal domain-containing protein [Flavihumibacter profundi]